MPPAVALVSTGLDSLLSAIIVKRQGVKVYGLHCAFSFTKRPDRILELQHTLASFDIPLEVEDSTEPFMEILRHPEHGFGAGVNPCIDCHMFMLRKAKAYMEKMGARFVITGEVVGQRAMSQNRPTLFHIEKEVRLERLILRPLSAHCLPVSIPEEEGWVERGKLYGIHGRSRKMQMALASQLGITRYSQPAGGCILTDPAFARRFKAFVSHFGFKALTSHVMQLLRHGRHFWPKPNLWVIVGRNEGDNHALQNLVRNHGVFEPIEVEGPLVLAEGIESEEDIHLVARILARYSDLSKDSEIFVRYTFKDKQNVLKVQPFDDAVFERWKVE